MDEIKFICPNCGATLIAGANAKKIKCKYCTSVFLEEEFREDIINSKFRAEVEEACRLRNQCDFEEAQDLLDTLIVEDAKNPEVYFQKLLLDYGVTYIDENEKVRQVPIFNYIKKEPMTKNVYYNKLMGALTGNEVKRDSYQMKINELEKLRQKVYDTYSKDEPYQIFLSFKKSDIENPTLRTRDLEIARRLYEKFTKEYHLKVFFSEETLKDVAGTEFEPHIFSALYSSKVFLLICASPDKPEYIRTPWIKSEWQRFAKRYDVEIDNKLALIPVFCNGYSESLLPRQLQRFEGYELNEEFYENMKKVLSNVLVGSKKTQFQQLNIGTKVSKLKTNKESITLRGFSDHKGMALVDFDKTDFDVAIASMKARTKKDFARAYEKLERVTKSNQYNYDANLAKLKCDFSISFEESLVNASFEGIKRVKYQQISKDLLATLAVASDEDRDKIVNAFVKILTDFYAKDPKGFLSMIDTPDDLLLTVVSAVDKEKMLEIILRFEEVYKDYYKFYTKALQSVAAKNWKKHKASADISVHKIFKKYYSNYDEEGAQLIIDNLSFTVKKAILAKDYSYADKLMDEILAISEYDTGTLWLRFLNATTRSIAPYGEDTINDLVKYLNEENFVTFPLKDELPAYEPNKQNLYYYIVKMIVGGAKMNLASEKSPFYVIFQAAMRMFNQKKKIGVAKDIIKTFTQMAESAKASKKEIRYILMRSANRLLVEELYEEAEPYFKEVLVRDDKDEEALWGLMKCEAKCPTNYSLIFYKKDLSELMSYRTVITCFKNNHPDAPSCPYLDFYTGLRNIKANKNKPVMKAFKYYDKKLRDEDDPMDDSPATILSLLQSNKLVSNMEEEILAAKNNKVKASKPGRIRASGGVKHSLLLTGRIITLILGSLGILASIILTHPFIALAVISVVWVVFAFLFKNCQFEICNEGVHIFWKLIVILVVIAAIIFGRIILFADVIKTTGDRIYFIIKVSEVSDSALIRHYIAVGLCCLFLIATTIVMLYDTHIDDVPFIKTGNRFFTLLFVGIGLYSAYIFVGDFFQYLGLIGLAIGYGVCWWKLWMEAI